MTEISDEKIEELVGQVKDKCRITWEDEGTDRIIRNEIIPSALSVIRFKVGIPEAVEFDFAASGLEHRLFLNYCYYAWHDAEDDFERNYASDIAHARRIWEVKNHASSEEGAADLS